MHVQGAAEPVVERSRADYINVLRIFAEKNKTKRKFVVDGRSVMVHPTAGDALVVELPRQPSSRKSRAVKIPLRFMYPGGFTAEFTGFMYGTQQKWVDVASADFKAGFTSTGLLLGVLGAVLKTADDLAASIAQAATEPEARTRASAVKALALLHKFLAKPRVVVVAGVSVTAARATPLRGFADASNIILKLHHSSTKDFVAVVDLGIFDPPDLYVTIKGRKPVPYGEYPMSAPELLRFAATKLVEQVYGPKFMARNGVVQAAAEPEQKHASTSRAVHVYEKLRAGLPAAGKTITYKNNTFTLKAGASANVPGNKYIVIAVGDRRMRLNVTEKYGPSLRNERDGWQAPPRFCDAVRSAQNPKDFLRTVLDAILWATQGHEFNYTEAAAEPEEYAGAEKRWLKAVRALPKEGVRVRFSGRETTVTPERNHLGEIGIGFDFYYKDVCYRISVLSHGSKLKIHSYHPILYVRHDVFAIPPESGADLLRAVLAVVVRKLSTPGEVTAAAEPALSVQERLLHLHDSLRSKYGRRPLLLPIGDDRRLRVDTGLEMEPNKHVTINYQDDDGSTLGHVVFFCLTRPGEPDRVACYFTQGGIRNNRRDFTVTESDLRRLVDDNSTLKFLVGKAKAMLVSKSAHRPTAAVEPALKRTSKEILNQIHRPARISYKGVLVQVIPKPSSDGSTYLDVTVVFDRHGVKSIMQLYVIGYDIMFYGQYRAKYTWFSFDRNYATGSEFLRDLVKVLHYRLVEQLGEQSGEISCAIKPVQATAAAEPVTGFETVFLRTWELLDRRPTDLRVALDGLEVVVHAGRDFSNKPNIFVNVCRGSVDLEMFTFVYVHGLGLRYTQGRRGFETCKTIRGKPVEDIQRVDAFLAGLVNFTYTLTEAKAGK